MFVAKELTPQVDGEHQQQFNLLKKAFTHNFTHLGESGAALCVYYRGKKVVDLYGSYKSTNGVWHEKDRVCTMSSSKAPLALCIHILAERGLLKLDDLVAQHWPEFSQQGKENVKIFHILNHTAGLPIIKNCNSGDIFNWPIMIKALEQSPLVFPVGTKLAYHALTYGHLIGEIIRRVDGRMPADFFYQEISKPLDIEYDLRYFPEQRIRPIIETTQLKAMPLWLYSKVLPLIPYWKMQYFRPCSQQYQPNSLHWKQAEIPAVTGQGSARGLAKIYAFLANNGELDGLDLCTKFTSKTIQGVSVEAIEQATKKQWRIGLGFMINSPEVVSFGPNSTSFGHMGMGGSVGFADPENSLSFAYVTEKYHLPNKGDKSMSGKRLQTLIDSCYQCISLA